MTVIFGTHRCGWCGEEFGPFDDKAEMGEPVEPGDDSSHDAILVHAEPCSSEANECGWIYA